MAMRDTNIILTINKVVKRYQVLRLVGFMVLFSILYSSPCLPAGRFSILTTTKAYAAQQTLRVSPVIINVNLSPNKTTTNEVRIENLTNTPLPLKATLNDFVTGGEEGGYVFEDTKTNPLLSWTKLSDDTFILNPKEKKKILMTVKTPTTIPVGGYYGVLFFQPVLQTASAQATQVSTKVGILMLANLGVPDDGHQKADILTFTPKQLSQDGTVPFLLRVQNTSLNFFTAKPILTINPVLPFSQVEKPVYLEEKLIFPDKVRRWTEDQTIHDLSPNIYKVHLSVSTGNGQMGTTDRYFVVFPVVKALIILMIILLIIFLTIKRNRLGTAARALFRS